MDLELATTRDILEELSKRETLFVFAGLSRRNRGTGDFYIACQGRSEDEVRGMARLLERRLVENEDL
jgi:hypothetical protein